MFFGLTWFAPLSNSPSYTAVFIQFYIHFRYSTFLWERYTWTCIKLYFFFINTNDWHWRSCLECQIYWGKNIYLFSSRQTSFYLGVSGDQTTTKRNRNYSIVMPMLFWICYDFQPLSGQKLPCSSNMSLQVSATATKFPRFFCVWTDYREWA